ncbi:cytochrome P450 [Aspergillus foveolatus]|uniref:cytochrome P450 n=1 Tax=Aspergillus foveolatus TaxID=210207 RepID=UPI003CCDFBB7
MMEIPGALFAAFAVGTAIVIWFWKAQHKSTDFPLIGTTETDGSYAKAAESFAKDSHAVLSEGLKRCKGPFHVATATGPKVVLPPRYLDDIKSDDRFSFAHEMAKQSLSHLPGFEAFATPLHNNIFQDTIKIKITQSLGAITESLSEETTLSLKELIGDSPEWKECIVGKTALDLTTRLSTRVFLGEKFARDQNWLDLSLAYTMTAMHAAQAVLKWPPILQRPANRFLPQCIQQRAMLQSIRDILEPEIKQRKDTREAALVAGKTPPTSKDTLDWMDEISRGRPFDLVLGQLQLGFVAIHTTSMLLTDVLLELCAHPEYVPRLREEIIRVLREDGWKKTSMYKLKRVDSFIKETLRLSPQSMITARRMTTETVLLPDGTKLPKGTSTMVPTRIVMLDPHIYPDPTSFDGERFFRQRTESETRAQLVTANIEYLGFGYGKHACPGRFLAANEIKVALCHLLLKYDFRFVDGESRPEPLVWETAYMTNPSVKVLVRRRVEEMDLSMA